MGKRVVIFGAGASYGARNYPSPPLGKYLHKWVLEYFNIKWNELNDFEIDSREETIRLKIKEYLENATSYEALANALLNKNEINYLVKLNFLLASSMTPPINLNEPNEEPRVDDSFVERPDVYDEWLKNCVKRTDQLKEFTFITLNYDCLLERAICRTFFSPDEKEGQCLCTHVHYPFIGGPTTGVEVFKLHGSINWVNDQRDYGEALDGNCPIPFDGEIGPTGVMDWEKIKAVKAPIGEDEIILAHYAPGKAAQANPGTLLQIRRRVLEQATHATSVLVIGVHIPLDKEDDPFLFDLFQVLKGKNVDFINPSEEENNLAESTFGFNTIQKSFKEYVACQT